MLHGPFRDRAPLRARETAMIIPLVWCFFLALLFWAGPRAEAQAVLGSEDFTIIVEAAPEPLTADLVGPETALQGATSSTAWLQALYDGDTTTTVFSSASNAVHLRFAAPVLTSGVHVSLFSTLQSRVAYVDALLDGAWVQVWSDVVGGNGTRIGYFAFPTGAVATTELRIRGGDFSVREFRAGHAGRAPVIPAWTSASGFAGKTGDTVTLAATGRNAWATAPLHYALAPGSSLPAGSALSADGTLTVGPVPTDLHPFTVRVSEGPAGAYAERALHITPNVPTADLTGPETALEGSVSGAEWLQGLYDGDTSTTVFSSFSAAVHLRFAAPVLTSGAQLALFSSLHTRTVYVDALVDGAWVQVWTDVIGGNGSRNGYFPFSSGAVATTELRIRSTLVSGTGVLLREFRAGHAGRAPVIPVWTSPAGFAGKTGDAVTLAATGRNAWATAPLHYALAPGSALPSGSALSADGTLTVGAVSTDWHPFTVRVSEGPAGAYAERALHIIPNVQTADLIRPETALRGTSSDTAWLTGLYDGNTSTNVFSSVTTPVHLRFAAPVLTSGVHVSLFSALQSRIAYVDALLDGAWVEVWSNVVPGNGSRNGYFAFPSGAVTTRELRIRGGDISVREFRAGHNGTAPIGAP